jgi:sulfite reductase beta subunit-like hemoprotein
VTGANEYTATIEALRQMWLAERLPGESVAQWLERTGRRRGVLA